METNIPEKVMAVLDQVESEGSARSTRLTVLKKWFEEPSRLRAFGLWIARRTAGRKGKAKGEAGELLNEARKLVGKASAYDDMVRPLDLAAAREFHGRAKGFQNTYKDIPFGITRVIRCWPLYLVELGLELYLGYSIEPTDGYHLAVAWAQNYDPRYGTDLNGPSKGKLRELVRFMFTVEALEESAGYQEAQARLARLAPAFPKPKRGMWGWYKMERNLSPV